MNGKGDTYRKVDGNKFRENFEAISWRKNTHETHGMRNHPAYEVWCAMKKRCLSSGSADFHLYGGRGITVVARWHTFTGFWADMGPTYKPGLSIERSDNNGPYSAGNCYWATPGEQSRNTRRTIRLQTSAGEMCLSDAAKRFGLNKTTLWHRFKRNCGAANLFAPVRATINDNKNKVNQ